MTGDWHDTLQLSDLGAQDVVKVRANLDVFTGKAVVHCHILEHEDEGMMAWFQIDGTEGTQYAGTSTIDSSCYNTAYVAPTTATTSAPTTAATSAATTAPTPEPTQDSVTASTVTAEIAFSTALTDAQATTAKASYKTRLNATYPAYTFGTVTMTQVSRRSFLPTQNSLSHKSLHPVNHRPTRRTVSYRFAATTSVPHASITAYESTDLSSFASDLQTALQTDIPGVTATVSTPTVDTDPIITGNGAASLNAAWSLATAALLGMLTF